jgi:hypothetical protein
MRVYGQDNRLDIQNHWTKQGLIPTIWYSFINKRISEVQTNPPQNPALNIHYW